MTVVELTRFFPQGRGQQTHFSERHLFLFSSDCFIMARHPC